MKDLDMELKDGATPAEDFHNDETPNIWALPDEENAAAVETSEEELEKPSFLRRLRGSRKDKTAEPEAAEVKADDDEDEPAYPFGNPDDYSDDNASSASSDDDDVKTEDAADDKTEEPAAKDAGSHDKDSDK
jgi:hypothetical protein